MCRRAAVTSCQCQERSWEFREELGILHWAGSTWAHPDCFHKHPAPKAAFETSTVLPFSGQRCLMCSHCSDQGYSRGNAHTAGQKNSAWEGKRWGNPPQKLFFLPWNLKHLGTANGQTWSFCFDGLRRTQPQQRFVGWGHQLELQIFCKCSKVKDHSGIANRFTEGLYLAGKSIQNNSKNTFFFSFTNSKLS